MDALSPHSRSPTEPVSLVAAWVDAARRKLRAGGAVGEADLDRLAADCGGSRPRTRQRLLYLHAVTPSIYAGLVAAAVHEPVAGSVTQIDPEAAELPYRNVHDAIVAGWRVVHFPQQRAPFDDREIDLMGHEFILEKLEAYDD
ncbi:MAG: hypothetical protein OXP69_14295 [Spirochaetaceae bacterium]|nr:hypothetical protein [Spirochaetaceae bacterium]